jgi:cell division protein YceG involved in septum cleavage
MDFYVKSLIITIAIVIIFIFIFSFIYFGIIRDSIDEQDKGYLNSLYTSITIQTNIGMKAEPKKLSMKYWIMVQSILSYIITIGFLYVIIKSIMKVKQE